MGRMQYDLIILKSEVKELKKAGNLEGQMDRSLKGLEEEQKAVRESVSDLFMKVQSLSSEFQVLTGRFDEALYFSEKSTKELVEERNSLIAQLKELEIAVRELEKKIASSAPPRPDAKDLQTGDTRNSDPPTKASGDTPKKQVKEAYMEAYGEIKDNRFSDAREKFESLLKDYPENEYSDNARFWIGESYYKEKNYEDAILAYEDLLKENPKSEKVSGALLKQGFAFYELKDEETGTIILEKLIEQFPDSEQAKIARKKIRPPAPPKKKK
jgi:tol-pal system protein YbgF